MSLTLGALSFYGSSEVHDEIPGIGQYEDFHTIDWQRDIARDRMRHRYIVKKRQDSLWDLIKVKIICPNLSMLSRLIVIYFCRELLTQALAGYASCLWALQRAVLRAWWI